MSESTSPDFATPLKVVASFNYTIDDLREGLAPQDVEKRKKRTWQQSLVYWVVFAALAMVIFIFLQRQSVTPRTGLTPSREPKHEFIDAKYILIPSTAAALAFTLFVAGVVASAKMSGAKSETTRDRAPIPIVGSVFVCVLLLIVAGLLPDFVPDIKVNPAESSLNLIAFAPWIVMFLIIIVLVLMLRGKTLERQWNSKPGYQRRRTITLDEAGVRNGDELGESFYKWSYFKRAWEKPNVLVLVDESDLRHILPKRAFEDVGGLESARSLIGSHIADSKFVIEPAGFPVRPITPPPIPRVDH